MKRFMMLVILFVSMFSSNAFAYDATANFSQSQPELVSGFFIECGPTKGGTYPSVTDCGKPTLKSDGTYDCALKNFTANPVYCVASNYDAAKKRISTGNEASMSITVTPPANLKLVITITTVSRLTKSGNVIATTTMKQSSVDSNKIVKEGTTGYRNSKGEYITNTTIVKG